MKHIVFLLFVFFSQVCIANTGDLDWNFVQKVDNAAHHKLKKSVANASKPVCFNNTGKQEIGIGELKRGSVNKLSLDQATFSLYFYCSPFLFPSPCALNIDCLSFVKNRIYLLHKSIII